MSAALGSDRGALARAVAAAAGATPGVSRLVPGPGVPVATLYAGGAVTGVGLADHSVSVHVAVDRLPLEPVMTAVVQAVGAVLTEAGDSRRVEVVVEDLDDAAFDDRARTGEPDQRQPAVPPAERR